MRHLLSAVLLAFSASAAEPVFTIGADPLPGEPSRIGVNLAVGIARPWSQQPQVNAWNTAGVLEPGWLQMRGRATGGDGRRLVNTFKQGASSGAGAWGSLHDGFFDGGTIRIYRRTGDAYALLREDRIARFRGGKETSPNDFELATDGPAVQEGDEYVAEIQRDDIPDGMMQGLDGKGFLHDWGVEKNRPAIPYVFDRSTVPPGAGIASLRLDLPAGSHDFGQPMQGANFPDGLRFPARPFTFSVWLRQDGLVSGTVRLAAGSMGSCEVQVGAEWKKHELRFTGQPNPVKDRLAIIATGPGKLWIDNPLVSEDALATDAWYPHVVQALLDLKPGTLRIWTLHENKRGAMPLRAHLSEPAARPMRIEQDGMSTSMDGDLVADLELCQKVGADPWIIMNPLSSEADWRDLAEFLHGPADSPMGQLRTARGRTEPWSAAFRHIWVECGNEAWNRNFFPTAWPGRAEDYGAWCRMLFAAFRSSPSYDAARMHLVVNGWCANTGPQGFGPTATRIAGNADVVDVGFYMGGHDSLVEIDGADARARCIAGLMSFQRMYGRAAATLATEAAEQSKKLQRPLLPAVYEFGPGYMLPGPGLEADPLIEASGKSLALAIATADSALTCIGLGYGPQNFFQFKAGKTYWATHVRHGEAWVPHAAYHALRLINRAVVDARQLPVQAANVPTVDLPVFSGTKQRKDGTVGKTKIDAVPGVPLISAWAFRGPDGLRIALLSRETSNAHIVVLELPTTPSGPGTITRLTGALEATNLTDETVKPVSEPIPVSGKRLSVAIPPCSLSIVELAR